MKHEIQLVGGWREDCEAYRIYARLGVLAIATEISTDDIHTIGTWLIATAERDLTRELLRAFYGDPCD